VSQGPDWHAFPDRIPLIAAFMAGATALAVAAWLVVANGESYVDSVTRLDVLRQAHDETSQLSSTTNPRCRSATPGVEVQLRRAPFAFARRGKQRSVISMRRGRLRRPSPGSPSCSASSRACTRCATNAAGRKSPRSSTCRPTTTLARDCRTGGSSLNGCRTRSHTRAGSAATWRAVHRHHGTTAVTDLHGGEAVDALLIEIARRFRAASREGDLFARLGATEFALATPDARDGRQLALLAQRLRDQLNETSQPPLADTPIGASIGIAFFPEDANDSAGIMAAANAAMYAARRAGRNHVAFNALAA
jgi:diguanylate cyclase (GGDEF)-like protein